MWFFIAVFFLLTSCGVRDPSAFSHLQEIPPSKQKQKIAFLQKKLSLAEKEEKKIKNQIDQLSEEVRDAELTYIRREIDCFEDIIRFNPKKKRDIDGSTLFLEERETLHRMIQNSQYPFEAQVVLDRILQLITELGNDGVY